MWTLTIMKSFIQQGGKTTKKKKINELHDTQQTFNKSVFNVIPSYRLVPGKFAILPFLFSLCIRVCLWTILQLYIITAGICHRCIHLVIRLAVDTQWLCLVFYWYNRHQYDWALMCYDISFSMWSAFVSYYIITKAKEIHKCDN